MANGGGGLSEGLMTAVYARGALRASGQERRRGGVCGGQFGPLRAEKTTTSYGREVAVKVCGH